MGQKVNGYWVEFCRQAGVDKDMSYDAFSFGHTKEMADSLGKLVVEGIKTGTSSGYALYEVEQEILPQIGEYSIVLDGEQQPLCVIQNKSVKVLPFHDVEEKYARLEGEGDFSLDCWRQIHLEFFNPLYLKHFGRKFRMEDLIVFEEFEVVYR